MALPNYTIEAANPFGAMQQGYTLGAGIRDDQFKQQQQAAALQQQQQQKQILQSLLTNKNATADDYANASVLIPGMKDNFKQAWEMKSTEQQQSTLKDAGQWYSAIVNGSPELAASQMKSRADAMEASGAPKREIDAMRAQSEIITAHPEFARTQMGMFLASIPGGDKVIAGAAALGGEQRAQDQAPATLAKAKAEADIKTVEAANAPTKTALDNQAAVNKARIDDLNVQISQADSETKRGQLVLERDKLTAEQGLKAQARGDDAQNHMDTLLRGLQTVESIKNHPGLKSTLGFGGTGSVTGKISGFIPGSDRVDLESLVTTLKSQEFLTGIKQMAGMGALSNAEGEKIASAIASLNLDQSPGAFKNALGVVQANLEKSQKKLIGSDNKLPTAGGGFVVKHPQFGNVNEGDVNRLLKQFPGSTREQVLQYLSQTGGK